MMHSTLRYLPAFKAAAELGNLRSASLLLHVTPSAISQQISKLEEQLGFVLFERKGRKVVLNEAGKVLLHRVRAGLLEIDEGAQEAATIANTKADIVIRISVVPSFGQRWLLARIGRWRSLYPGIRLQIEATQQAVELAREGIHAGIRAGDGLWPGLISEQLTNLDRPLVLVGGSNAALRLAASSPEAIANEFLLGDPVLWQKWFKSAGVTTSVQPAATFADTGLMLQAVEQDIGLALARGLYTVDALREGRLFKLSEITLPVEIPQRFFLVYPPALKDWGPLIQLSTWLKEELAKT
ncbi:LysR substrate-binding domain-containing protein [Rahnella inusitata]|uniref:LysR substrate-binding domain-containing protein n=1 Tax=Rahnella inusitata TaxID=58169 RepID=UPI0039AF68F1